MTPEALLLRVCLLLVAAALVGLWQLRDGTRISAWLDREINAATTLPRLMPQATTHATSTRLETFL